MRQEVVFPTPPLKLIVLMIGGRARKGEAVEPFWAELAVAAGAVDGEDVMEVEGLVGREKEGGNPGRTEPVASSNLTL
ncbi:MAG: hypothetical protein ACNS63_08720 [Candidatus Nitrospinota bacterium M3_3B_026]